MGRKQRRGTNNPSATSAPASGSAVTQGQGPRKKLWPLFAGVVALVALGASAWYFSVESGRNNPAAVAATSSPSKPGTGASLSLIHI